MGTFVSSPQSVWQGNETYTWASKGVWTFLNDPANFLYLMLVPACRWWCLDGITGFAWAKQWLSSVHQGIAAQPASAADLGLAHQSNQNSCPVGEGCQLGTSAALSLLWDIRIEPVANILGLVLEFYLCPPCNSYCKLWTHNSCQFGGDFQRLCSEIPLIPLLWFLASRRQVRAVRWPPESSSSHSLRTPSTTVRRVGSD